MGLEAEGYTPPEESVNRKDYKPADFERFKNNYPRVDKAFDSWRRINCSPKSVNDLTRISDEVIHINTNSAALTRIDSEVYTDAQYGCVSAYGHNGKEKIFAHITPNDYLGYKYRNFPVTDQQKYVDVTVDRILRPSLEKGDTKGFNMVLLVNLASEDGSNYSRERQEQDLMRLKQSFERHNIQVGIVELPLANSAVFSAKENPDQLIVVGQNAKINDRGGIDYSDKAEDKRIAEIDIKTASAKTSFLQKTRSDSRPSELAA